MFATKPISPESVAGALAKAERYRLLNEPEEAESICRDILEIEPDNHQALIRLILALTDQIPTDAQAFSKRAVRIANLHAPVRSRLLLGDCMGTQSESEACGRRPRRASIRLRMDCQRAAILRRGGAPPRGRE